MIGRLRLRLSTSSNVFRLRNRARPPNPFAGELTTQDDIYLFTQDGRGIEMNQDVIDEFPGLLTQAGLEFITQDGRHLLTSHRD